MNQNRFVLDFSALRQILDIKVYNEGGLILAYDFRG